MKNMDMTGHENNVAQLPYHFPSHSVFCVDREPLCVCLAEDRLLVATVGHCVEVRDLDPPCGRVRHAFSTVDLVKQIVYSKTGKYVATLEVKTSRHSLMTHVRVYLNWQQPVAGHSSIPTESLDGMSTWFQQQPMRARIAGQVTPSSQADIGQLEMVELPLKRQPTLTNVNAANVNCCPATGNLVVACGFTVSIFQLCIKVHDISKLQFQDLEHLMDVHFIFPIKEVALCEEYLAAASACEVHVIRIRFRREKISSIPTSSRDISIEAEDEEFVRQRRHAWSPKAPKVGIKDDPHFIEWNCDLISADKESSHGWEYQDRLRQSLAPDSWPLTIKLPSMMLKQSLHGANDVGLNVSDTIFGPAEYFPGYPVQIEYTGILNTGTGSGSNIVFEPVSLLHRRFPVPLNAAQRFCLHSLQFSPLYFANCKLEDVYEIIGTDNDPSSGLLNNNGNPLLSRRHNRLGHLEVFFSTQNEGFIYDIFSDNQVKRTSRITYGNDVVCQAFLEANALHAVSYTGINTYSIDNWNSILARLSPVFSILYPKFAFGINERVRLLGCQPFLNIRNAAYGDANMVLLTSAPTFDLTDTISNAKWTAYVLQCPPAEYLYNDLVEMISNSKEETEATIFAEYQAAIILATEMLINCPSDTSRLARLFSDACCRIGDGQLKRHNGDKLVSLAFYDVSKAPLDIILNRIIGCNQARKDKSWIEIMEILQLILLEKRFSRYRYGSVSKETANAIINVFVENNSSFLADIFLNCFLHNYDFQSIEYQLIIKKLQETKEPKNLLAICLLSLKKNDVSQISKYISELTDENLIELTWKYPNVWFQRCNHDDGENNGDDGNPTFTQLMQFVQQLKPNPFIKMLQQLIVQDCQISSKIVPSLCRVDWEDIGLAPRTDTLLLNFLEDFLTNKSLHQWHCTEATTTLITLYLRCLANVDPKGMLPPQKKPWSLFGPRHTWLNTMTPFIDRSIHDLCQLLDETGEPKLIDEPNEIGLDCACVSCNNCLLRLQSLLCNPELASMEMRGRVALTTSVAPDTLKGILSLRVLCSSSVSNAFSLLIPTGTNNRPEPLLEYSRQTFRHDINQWKLLLSDLLAKMANIDIDDKDIEVDAINAAINGVVSQLAELMPPDQLVALLPTDCAKFVPQVRKSIARHQSKQLLDLIIDKGRELKKIV